ncbi:hypothetical protein [Massilia sp. PWRC2]|uniref:hypothetical protein n=1 Tax=Massilia sp. PWRC2 TaxID=2804626 RepID=UPI003CEB4321
MAAALLAKKPRNQGGGCAKRHCCQELNEVDVEKIGRPLKFGGLGKQGKRKKYYAKLKN